MESSQLLATIGIWAKYAEFKAVAQYVSGASAPISSHGDAGLRFLELARRSYRHRNLQTGRPTTSGKRGLDDVFVLLLVQHQNSGLYTRVQTYEIYASMWNARKRKKDMFILM
jgi:hypothetical protein